MGLGKTYSTKYLLDSNNSSGVAGQVLSTTSTGIDWVDANTVPGTGLWLANGNDIYNSNSGNVGIGTTLPGAKLDVQGTILVNNEIQFVDANMRIFRSSNDMRIRTGGSDKVTILSGGNVGIGLTPNASYSNLQIKTPSSAYGLDLVGRDAGSSSESQITFWNSNQTSVLAAIVNSSDSLLFYTGTTERMRIDSSGNVGIGEDNPTSLLHLYKASGDPMINIQAVSGGDPGITFTSINNRTGNIFYSDGTTNAKLTYDHADTSFKLYAHNTSVADFVLNETTSYFPTQNVGIGITNPILKLHIEGTNSLPATSGIAQNGGIRIENGVNNGVLDIGASNASGAPGWLQATDKADLSQAYKLLLNPNGGDVGIGTTSPNDALEVAGNSATNHRVRINNANASGAETLAFVQDTTFKSWVEYNNSTGNFDVWQYTNNPLRFATNNTERMRITSAGAISFGSTGTAYGTSGQILKSNGNASPTWIDGSAIPGVPGGSGTLNTIPLWTPDGDTLGDSILSQNGTSIYQGVAGTSASGYYYFNTTTTGDSGLLFADNTSTNSGFLTYNHDVDAMKFGTSNTERMRIDSNGDVGIGTTNPGAKLVVTDNNDGQDTTFKVNHTRSNSDVATQAIEVSMSLSGADTTTADRVNSGILVDVVSTADGDTSNEHRLYGVYSDVTYSGMSDLVRAGYFKAESNNNIEKTAQTIGIYGQAVHDASSANGGVTTLAGVYGVASLQDTGDVSNAYGGFFLADIPDSRVTDVNVVKGVEGHIDINKETTISYGNMSAVSAVIDNNEGSVPNFGSQYLFKGDYQGTKGSNAYGVYCEGDKHYLQGSVGIGILNPAQSLHVSGNARVTGAYYDSNNSPGTANQVLISTVTGTDWVDGSGSSIIGGPYLPLAGGTMDSGAIITMSGNLNLTYAYPRINLTDTNNDSDYSIINNDGIFGIYDVTNNSYRLSISAAGNVGIGTTSPVVKLQVSGTNASVGVIGTPKSDWYTTAYNGIQIADGTTIWGRAGDSHFSGNCYVKDVGGSAQDTYINALSAHDLWLDNTSGSLKYRNAGLGGAGNAITFNTRFVVLNNGNFGIGTDSPDMKIDVEDNSTTWAGRILNTNSNGQGLLVRSDSTTASNFVLGVYGDGGYKMVVRSDGNVGIGTTSPNAPLQFSNAITTRKVVLYEMANNNNQFYGFGVEAGRLVYSTANTGDDHVFYAGASSTSRNELIRIDGSNGDIKLSPSSRIILDDTPTASTASGSGTIVKWSVSESTTAGSLYVVKTNGGWQTTDADTEANSIGMLAIALGSNATAGMLLQGFFYKASHGFTIGLPLYISNTAGAFSTTRPTGTNDYVRIIGYATSANYIYFDPDKTWVKLQ